MRASLVCGVLLGLAPMAPAMAGGQAARAVEWRRDILPVLERACTRCHGEPKHAGGLRLDRGAEVLKGGVSGNAIVPGDAAGSYLVQRILGAGQEDRMPLEGEPLPARDVERVRRWIDEGAHVPREKVSPFSPAPAGVRRLTSAEYESAIRDLLALPPATPLDPDDAALGSFASVAAYRVATSNRGVEQYQESAVLLAGKVFVDPALRQSLVGCQPMSATDACAHGFLARFARRAWRREARPPELDPYEALMLRAATPPFNVWFGLQTAVAALLQSPRFLYVVETGSPDPARPRLRRYTSVEMATRLALFIWGSLPDAELLDAAAADRLASAEGVRLAAARMLASPRARAGVRRFFDEYLGLDRRRMTKDARYYPKYTNSLPAAMKEEVNRVIEDLVFERKADFLSIFDTRETFVNAALARLYDLPSRPGDHDETFYRVTLPEDGPRAGLLGFAAILSATSIAIRTSPTNRGVFIREQLLCEEVPPPPANISAIAVDQRPADPRTMRDRMSAHATNPTCAGCHAYFDPLGFALERFDGIGGYRATEGGFAIDARGKLDGKPLDDARVLGRLLRRDPRTAPCLARQLYRYAVGHEVTAGEAPVLAGITNSFARSGHELRELILAIATSDGFRYALARSGR